MRKNVQIVLTVDAETLYHMKITIKTTLIPIAL
jgi:hypothetical protein